MKSVAERQFLSTFTRKRRVQRAAALSLCHSTIVELLKCQVYCALPLCQAEVQKIALEIIHVAEQLAYASWHAAHEES